MPGRKNEKVTSALAGLRAETPRTGRPGHFSTSQPDSLNS
ncbi:MAG: hypothetical protein AVDCRST_MAG56-5485 [uncultured Cytophagales bacterium]|uniref:Uncharacterized protein n=1 Tax=uncultured Cytophagales bacterium TaxID=158755 RepID=A0A6J4KB14_9SPHI|nr:MAG: hypothetical protein AVDCRST_MAG56-5485 [uncultured Cytophagales bacterium]